MKLRVYDKYGKQHLIIEFEDEVYTDSSSSSSSTIPARLTVTLDEEYYKNHLDEHAEDPEFKRWSDLTDVEVIHETNHY